MKAEGKKRGRLWTVAAVIAVVAVAIVFIVTGMRGGTGSGSGSGTATFVGAESCAACHAAEMKTWRGSHHDLAMQVASRATILADFKGETFTLYGVTSRFFQRDGKFIVNTDGPDGKLADFEVKYAFGVDPLQQYLIELNDGRGRVQCLTIAWDTRKKKWFTLYPDEKIVAGDPLHWTGRMQSWNHMCADCHSTKLDRNYDAVADKFETKWAEINVGCEACHGPGSGHVAWANAGVISRWMDGTRGLKQPLVGATNGVQVDACASCHARRHTLADGYVHGQPLLDTYMPETLQETLYHADGQIDGEVYEYGSFTQSKMFAKGIKCSDCHEPHSLQLRAPIEGNALCIRCHDPVKFNTPAHFNHLVGSTGSLCVNCHMPTKTYMQVHVRRDHSLRVPRPDWSVALGTPNACNQCHADKTSQWAADAIVKWFGPTRKPSQQEYAVAFAAARAGKPEAPEMLGKVWRNPETPAIARATAMQLLARYGPLDPKLGVMKDASGVVRAAGIAAMDSSVAANAADIAAAAKDPVRAVRMEAGRLFAQNPAELKDGEGPGRDVMREYERSQMQAAYDPGAWVNMGVVHGAASGGDPNALDHAERDYKNALRLDPTFVPAKINLANLYSQQQRNADAEKLLREVVRDHPEYGEAQYSLGLLLGESPERAKEARDWLGRAAALLKRPRVYYNYALALQHAEQFTDAEVQLIRANELDPNDMDILYDLAICSMQVGKPQRAAEYAQQMLGVNPSDRRAIEILAKLQRR